MSIRHYRFEFAIIGFSRRQCLNLKTICQVYVHFFLSLLALLLIVSYGCQRVNALVNSKYGCLCGLVDFAYLVSDGVVGVPHVHLIAFHPNVEILEFGLYLFKDVIDRLFTPFLLNFGYYRIAIDFRKLLLWLILHR